MILIILVIIVFIEAAIKIYTHGKLKELDGIGHVHRRGNENNTIHLNVMDTKVQDVIT
jgi:hypothetical protein